MEVSDNDKIWDMSFIDLEIIILKNCYLNVMQLDNRYLEYLSESLFPFRFNFFLQHM